MDYLITTLFLACIVSGLAVVVWAVGNWLFNNDPKPMAVDLWGERDDPTLRLKATTNRDGYSYAITDDEEHA